MHQTQVQEKPSLPGCARPGLHKESTTGIGAIINENISGPSSPPDEIFFVFCRYGPSININLSPKSSPGGSAMALRMGYGPSPDLKAKY
jgi:hypothetical protein